MLKPEDKVRIVRTRKSPPQQISLFHPYISPRVADTLKQALETRWIGQGPRVERVEDIFRFQFKVPHAIAVNSCTSALHLALILSGVKPRDEVVTTPLTCYASVAPILYERARPVFADIQPETLNIDPESIEKKITKRTRAIMIVHWAGMPCDMDEIKALAWERGIPVIADAAHALGASYRGRLVGGISPFTCFSFQAIKQITTGDGGMLTTLSAKHAMRARLLRWYGIDRDFKGDIYKKFQVRELGYKYHMNDLAASMLMVQLEALPAILERRRQIVSRYREALQDLDGIKLFDEQEDRESAHWLFNILVDRRKNFQRRLAQFGIETSLVHIRCDMYPILGGKRQNLPGMDWVEPRYLSLPLHNHLSDEDVEYIIEIIRQGW